MQALGAPVAETMLGQRVGYAAAMGQGRVALETRSPAQAEVRGLVSEVAARLNAG